MGMGLCYTHFYKDFSSSLEENPFNNVRRNEMSKDLKAYIVNMGRQMQRGVWESAVSAEAT